MLKLNAVTNVYQLQGRPRVAANYGEGVFDGCSYDEGCASGSGTTTNPGSSSSAGGGGGLADTGVAVALIFAVACLIIFVSLLVRFWRRPQQQQPVPEEVPAETEEPLVSEDTLPRP